MSIIKQMREYYTVRYLASRERDLERGEVSATTIVMAAALVGLAVAVSAIITSKVRDKALNLNLG